MMSDDITGLGWLPVEAREDLEERRSAASREEAAKLIALPPRERVLELLRRATCKDETGCPKLRPAALIRVLESFEGEALPAASDLADRFPLMVEDEA